VFEIKNNLELAQHLEKLPAEQRQAEYIRLMPTHSFSVKSLGYLMTRYEKWKKDHAGIDSGS
jgi:hypothetical protein